jgi:hypothetical protein
MSNLIAKYLAWYDTLALAERASATVLAFFVTLLVLHGADFLYHYFKGR